MNLAFRSEKTRSENMLTPSMTPMPTYHDFAPRALAPAFKIEGVKEEGDVISINGVTYKKVENLESETSADMPSLDSVAESRTANVVERDENGMYVPPK